MFRLAIKPRAPICLVQRTRRLATDAGDIQTGIQTLTQSAAPPEDTEGVEHPPKQRQSISLKKDNFQLRLADGLARRKMSQTTRTLRSRLMRVDYIPEGTTELELMEIFSKYGGIGKVQIGSSRLEEFFGRAYVMFASANDLKSAWEKLENEDVVVRGTKVALDAVEPTATVSETVYIGNLDASRVTREDIMEEFAKYGLIQSLVWDQGNAFGHVIYESVTSAELAIHKSFVNPVFIHGKKVFVGPAHDIPRRTLHIAGFSGDMEYVRNITQKLRGIRGITIAPTKDGKGSMAWVTFDSITDALLAKGILRKNNPEINVLYAKNHNEPRNTPPQPKIPMRTPRPAPPVMQPSTSVAPSVLHVSNIPNSTTTQELQACIEQHVPSSVASIVVQRSSPDGQPSTAQEQDGHYTALVSLNDPGHLDKVLEAHTTSPFNLETSKLDIQTAFLDKLNAPGRTIVLSDAPDYRLTPSAKIELWEKMGSYGKIQDIVPGQAPDTILVKYATTPDAIAAMAALALRPLVVQGIQPCVNFAAPQKVGLRPRLARTF